MPIITTAAITSLITILSTKGVDKLVETGVENISTDAYNWIKSLFYKNEEPKNILKELQKNPNDSEHLSNAASIVRNSLEDNPLYEDYLNEIIQKLPENTISNSKNVITGNISTGGGHFVNGDNNQIS